MASAITGTSNISNTPSAYSSSTALSPAIQTIWSKEILFQSVPTLRFEQFAVKKTELGVQPGLQINFMRYNNLGEASQLTEGIRMEPQNLSASQFSISVAEQGHATAVTELLLNASFDDVMASTSRLLGRNMAQYLDKSARETLLTATSMIFGYKSASTATAVSPYDKGTAANSLGGLDGDYRFHTSAVKDGVEILASKDVPRLGETYVCFVHPHQSRDLRDNPQWIEVTKYASPGNFMLGEIGRIDDVVFIETTQVRKEANKGGSGSDQDVYTATMIGDNAFGHAVSLPVELRDGGVQDFGREHHLAWYAIWGFGLITDEAVVNIATN